MAWVDAHTHLDLPAFDADRHEVLHRATAAGVGSWVICAADPAHWDRVEALGRHLAMPWTLGVHPWWGATLDHDAHTELLAQLHGRPTPHGIGETGLDHGRARSDAARDQQQQALRAHLALARERNVPVVIHCVRAYPQLLRILEADGLPDAGGMIHSWSGPAELVPRAVRLGLHLSFSASFTRSDRLAAALCATPATHLLLETDSPDQPLAAHTRSEPAHLVEVAAAAAALRQTTPEALLDGSTRALRRLFPALASAPHAE